MGYSIAYNSGTTTPFGTFKQGTITMGLKPQEYTVSSGFTWYANATTPNDNYLIISDTYSQGWSTQAESKPTIWRSETGTTESFVSLVNQLPDVNGVTGFTDSGTAMKYLMDTGKYFVNKDDYLGIVSDGLVLNLDAGWYPSYSGSGTTWKDIKGTNNGTLTNGPTFNSANGGSIVFDGTNDYAGTNYTEQLENFTVCAFFKDTGTNQYGRVVDKSFSDGFWFGRNGGGTNQYGGGCKQTNGYNFITLPAGDWHFMSMVRNGTSLTVYGDGITNTNTTTCGSGTISSKTLNVGATINDGWPSGPSQRDWWTGNIPIVLLYNRALSASEVLQNYNAQKGRFGL